MTASSEGTVFEVNRGHWDRTRARALDVPEELDEGQVLFRVDRFALTSNNISYAVAGDMLNYWGFFPAEEGWGRIPVMGFGEVLRSAHPGAREGERFFGFYPMASHLLIEATDHPEGLIDGIAHRSGHAPVYRQYSRASTDPLYTVEGEDLLMLLRGLFMTSFLVDDFVADSDSFGATRLLVSSASSKTSIALAFQASQREGLEVVGLTSPGNAEFVDGLGLYDRTVLYSEIESLDASTPSVFVDMAGNRDVVRRIHEHLGDTLRYDCTVGATHWEAGGANEDMPGPKPEFFFAPGQIGKRAKDWGPEKLQQLLGEGWARFRDASKGWLEVQRHAGADELARVYAETLAGKASPRVGNVMSLWSDS
jgi:hypothetical protein